MSIHYHNRRRVAQQVEEALEATYWDSLDQMLARMDFISVNCPHTPATYHLLSARRLKHLRPEAIVINTARGEVIDEAALTRMLEAGEIASAGLDVFEHAPGGVREADRARQRRQGDAAASPGLGDVRGPQRPGREGHHQHQDLHRRPPAARPRPAEHAVRRGSPDRIDVEPTEAAFAALRRSEGHGCPLGAARGSRHFPGIIPLTHVRD